MAALVFASLLCAAAVAQVQQAAPRWVRWELHDDPACPGDAETSYLFPLDICTSSTEFGMDIACSSSGQIVHRIFHDTQCNALRTSLQVNEGQCEQSDGRGLVYRCLPTARGVRVRSYSSAGCPSDGLTGDRYFYPGECIYNSTWSHKLQISGNRISDSEYGATSCPSSDATVNVYTDGECTDSAGSSKRYDITAYPLSASVDASSRQSLGMCALGLSLLHLGVFITRGRLAGA